MMTTYIYRFLVQFGVLSMFGKTLQALFWSIFWGIDFGSIFWYDFAPFLAPKMVQNWSKIDEKMTLKSFSTRSSEKRKNIKKCHRVASKSRFAGPAVDAKMSLRSDLRPAKNASSANRRKRQIFDRFGLHFGTILGAKIDAKSHQKLNRKSIPQKIDQQRA